MKFGIAILICVVLLAPPPASAKPFWQDKWWYAGRAVSAGMNVLDAESTVTAFHACPGCGDSFPFWTAHSTRSIALAALVDFGMSTGFSILEHKLGSNGSKAERIVSYTIVPAGDAAVHGYAAAYNFNVAAQCREAKLAC